MKSGKYRIPHMGGKQTPVTPNKTECPVKYHCHDSCNKCSGVNDCEVTGSINGRMSECKTKCKDCGFEDYWAHGYFESGQEMQSKCNTYSFSR